MTAKPETQSPHSKENWGTNSLEGDASHERIGASTTAVPCRTGQQLEPEVFSFTNVSLNASGNILFGASGKIAMIAIESDKPFLHWSADGADLNQAQSQVAVEIAIGL